MNSVGISDDEVHVLITDFNTARAHMTKYLCETFTFWQKLPWRLAALVHWIPEYRVRAAKIIVKMFDESPQNEDLHDRVTWHWLSPGSVLRQQIDKLISGTPLSELHQLKQAIAELMFVPIVERVQEAEHLIVARETTNRHVTGACVSLLLRFAEIVRDIMPNKDRMLEFVICLEMIAGDPEKEAQGLGLHRHPLMLQVLVDRGQGQRKRAKLRIRQLLQCLLYSVGP